MSIIPFRWLEVTIFLQVLVYFVELNPQSKHQNDHSFFDWFTITRYLNIIEAQKIECWFFWDSAGFGLERTINWNNFFV